MRNFLFLLIFISSASFAKSTTSGWLNGNISTFDSNGKEIPWSGNKILISYEKNKYKTAALTNDSGDFHLFIKKPMVLGTKIRVKLQKDDYFILSPYNGEFFPPEDITSYELNIIVVSNSSKKVQVGPLYADFSNKSIEKRSQEQIYTVQVLSTSSKRSAIETRDFFIKSGYDSESELVNGKFGLLSYKVYVTNSKNWEDSNKVKNKIRKSFKGRYKDSFVKSILFPVKNKID